MATQEKCSWIDSEDRMQSIVSEVKKFYCTGLYTDCVLVGGGARIRCHTAFLASVSPLFKSILPQPVEDREDTVVIFPDWEEGDLDLAVKIIHFGAVNNNDNAEGRERAERVAALLESIIGVKRDLEDVSLTIEGIENSLEVEGVEKTQYSRELETEMDGANNEEQQICDITTGANNEELRILNVTTVATEEMKVQVEKNQLGKQEELVAYGDQIKCTNNLVQFTKSSSTISKSGEKVDASKKEALLGNTNLKIQCFRCAGEQANLSEYITHLLEHQVYTKKCVSELLIKLGNGEKEEDWLCESCYICLLSDQQKMDLGQEAYNVVTKHNLVCLEEVEKEIEMVKQKLEVSDSHNKDETPKNSGDVLVVGGRRNGNLIEEDFPTCDQCGKNFKLMIQLRKHKKSCSGLIQAPSQPGDTPSSLLGLLTASNWTECPCCWEKMDSAAMAFHLITHQEIKSLLDDDTQEQGEYRCSDTRHTAKNNLERLLDRFTLGDIKVMEESSMDDIKNKETSDDGIWNVGVHKDNGSLGESNVPISGSSANVSVTGSEKRRHRSGKSGSGEDNFRKYRDASGENMPSSQKCTQCLRVFQNIGEYQSRSKHFCVRVGKLSEPLSEDLNPTPTKLVINKCTICVGGPVLASEYDLKKHLTLAHKGNFFVTNLQKNGFDTKKFPTPCYISDCNKDLTGWEDAITHVGIEHEKLFQALKHDPANDYKVLLKRLFPEKFQKWFKSKKQFKGVNTDFERKNSCEIKQVFENARVESSMKTGISTMESEVVNFCTDILMNTEEADSIQYQNAAKRKLVLDENGKTQKKVRKLDRASSSESRGVSEEESSKKSKGKGKPAAPKERMICKICPPLNHASYAGKTSLYKHMADAHFSDYILTHYPLPTESILIGINTSSYPCLFPSCKTILTSSSARVKHLGVVHRQVDTCLAIPKLVEQAKEKAMELEMNIIKQRPASGSSKSRRGSLDSDNITCKKCETHFATRESLKLHTCHSLRDKRDHQCTEGGNSRSSNIRSSESPIETSDRKIAESVSEHSKENPRVPIPLVLPVGSCPITPPKSASPTDLGQIVITDSEEEEPSSDLAIIRKKVNKLIVSDTDSDDTPTDLEDENMLDINELRNMFDTPSPPGMVLVEAVTADRLDSCPFCNVNFGSATNLEIEMHRKCAKCFDQFNRLIHKTCDKHISCEYCLKCYYKGHDVHVTCDAAKCKKCFSSEKDKKRHFQEHHGWDDL